MTTCAFWSTAGLEMVGGAVGDAAAMADPDGLAVAEVEPLDWPWSVVLRRLGAFLQPVRASTKHRERNANRVGINAVKAFKLERRNYKRFLDFHFAQGRPATPRSGLRPKYLWQALDYAV